MDPNAALARLGGAARWRALIDAGVTDGDVRAAVRQGLVLRRGPVYALPGAADDVVLAATVSGQLTCASAARVLGLDLLAPPDVPHVAVSRSSRVRRGDAVLHRVGRGTGSVAPLLEVMTQSLRCLPALQALVIVDCALRTGLLKVEAIRSALQGPGSVEARSRLAWADPRSGSLIETVARVALRTAGLPLQTQVWIANVGRVDFLVGGWLVVEIDGFEHHATRAGFRDDRRRANRLTEQGYVLLRFSYEDVMYRRDEMVAIVAYVLRRGRPRAVAAR